MQYTIIKSPYANVTLEVTTTDGTVKEYCLNMGDMILLPTPNTSEITERVLQALRPVPVMQGVCNANPS